jgi:hypothetical protein
MTRFRSLSNLMAVLSVLALTGPRLAAVAAEPSATDGWQQLFDGRTLEGWKANENPDTFRVQDGCIVVAGPRSHLFYNGPVGDADFRNFHWRCEIMTRPQANSGMYFHTAYQEEGWPSQGYEVQVNNTHSDPKKTGGLYAVQDVLDQSSVKDNEWFTQEVIVQGKHIVVKVNGKVTADYTEPDDVERPAGMEGRRLSHGTVALQGHDPDSVIHYRKVEIKLLP